MLIMIRWIWVVEFLEDAKIDICCKLIYLKSQFYYAQICQNNLFFLVIITYMGHESDEFLFAGQFQS